VTGPGRGQRRLGHEARVLLLALAAGAPGALAAFALLLAGDYAPRVRWTLGPLIVVLWWGFALAVQGTVVRPLQTLSNLLAALREEDFSFRARAPRRDDALGGAMAEVNALATTLREQRLGALEASALLRKVMEEIDVAVFTFDGGDRLRLVNRAGERLLDRPEEQLLGRTAEELGLATALAGDAPTVLDLAFPGGGGRWEARHGTFRQGGLPHRLLVLANLSRALRDEERQAWQRLIRVLGHELNNSLAPIRSIAESLEGLLARSERAPDWEEDMRRGLAVIGSRSESLSRFMDAYSRLARLPPPERRPLEVAAIVHRIAGLETRLRVEMRPGPAVTLLADPDQLEQLLINLLRNAADAALEAGGGVRIGWRVLRGPRAVELYVEDDGPGLPNTANLFVPFFTTKPQGSGIGLVLSRQIAEAHGGSLALENRKDGPGCRATLRLPI
jgi:nitrogen fixation/metabolism regulation signal transduction histidine kinase